MYRCSNCGATLSYPLGKCPRCGILLAGVKCQTCGYKGATREFVKNGDRCPKCQARVGAPNENSAIYKFSVWFSSPRILLRFVGLVIGGMFFFCALTLNPSLNSNGMIPNLIFLAIGIIIAAGPFLWRKAKKTKPILSLKDELDSKRTGAARAPGNIGDTRAVEPPVVALKDSDDRVREAAVTALEKIGDPTIESFVEALKDSNNDVRKVAARALAKIGDPAIEPLVAVWKDSNSPGRMNAAMALVSIGAMKFESYSEAVDMLVAIYNETPHGEGFLTSDTGEQARLVREIGRILNGIGGMDEMLEAHAQFKLLRPRAARNLEMMWDGVGGWRG